MGILSFIISIIFIVVMGVITQKILEKKGYELSWKWVLLLLFLPALAPLIALSEGPNPEKFGKCPYCRSIIELGATVCPHCGHDIPSPLSLNPQQQASQQTIPISQKTSRQQASQQTTSTSEKTSRLQALQHSTSKKTQIRIIPTKGLEEKKKEVNEFGHKTNIKKSQNKVS